MVTAFVLAQSLPGMIFAAGGLGFLWCCAWVVRGAARAVVRPRARGPMIASGLVTAVVLVLPEIPWVRDHVPAAMEVMFLPVCVLAGLVFGLSYVVGALVPLEHHPFVGDAAAVVFVGIYWLVNTAILGTVVAALRVHVAPRVRHDA